jgi:hypothetical protein
MCISMLLGNDSGKISLSLLGNGSVKMLPQQRIHTQRQKNCWTRRFLCGPCRIKGSRRLVVPSIFFIRPRLRSKGLISCFRAQDPLLNALLVSRQINSLPLYQFSALCLCDKFWFERSSWLSLRRWVVKLNKLFYREDGGDFSDLWDHTASHPRRR